MIDHFFMEEYIQFESVLYQDDPIFENLNHCDVNFCVDRLVNHPSLRPLLLEKVVSLCKDLCHQTDFKEKLVEKSALICPVLLFRLFKLGVYTANDIKPLLQDDDCWLLCVYFRKQIRHFESCFKTKRKNFNIQLYNDNDIDQMIDYGFVSNSIEFCLKYDDLEVLKSHHISLKNNNGQIGKWNPFEWAKDPVFPLDYLAFSGYFGSARCFKYLLLNGYEISDIVSRIVVCGGNSDLFHICNDNNMHFSEHICLASQYCRMSILSFLVEKGVSVNTNNLCKDTALHMASKHGHISVVEFLIQHKAELNKKDWHDVIYNPKTHPFI